MHICPRYKIRFDRSYAIGLTSRLYYNANIQKKEKTTTRVYVIVVYYILQTTPLIVRKRRKKNNHFTVLRH